MSPDSASQGIAHTRAVRSSDSETSSDLETPRDAKRFPEAEAEFRAALAIKEDVMIRQNLDFLLLHAAQEAMPVP